LIISSSLDNKGALETFKLIFFNILSTVLDLLSIGIILPVMSVLLGYHLDFVDDNLGVLYSLDRELLIAGTFLLLLLATLFKVYAIGFTSRFAFSFGEYVSTKLYTNSLGKSYLELVTENTGEEISKVTSKLNIYISNFIYPTISIVTALISLLVYVVVLAFIDLRLLGILGVCLGAVYIAVVSYVKARQVKTSEVVNENLTKQSLIYLESLQNIKAVKVFALTNYYIEKYKKVEKLVRSAQAKNVIYVQAPRYIVENAAIFLIIAIAFGLYTSGFYSAEELIFSLTIIVLILQRLFPVVQQIYRSYANINTSIHTIVEINQALIEEPVMLDNHEVQVKVDQVYSGDFEYGWAGNLLFRSAPLDFKVGENYLIWGASGAGKTTLVNLVANLYLNDHFKSMRGGTDLGSGKPLDIGYADQTPLIFDESIEFNITLKHDLESSEAIRYADIVAIMGLENLSESFGVDRVGEQGARLSGGQKQRISLGRALYKAPSILILDETLSALDSSSETKILTYLLNLKNSIKIFISHNEKYEALISNHIHIHAGVVTQNER